MSRPMNDDEVLTEMKKMVAFIKQEALEKAREIQVKADEEFAIEKAKIVRQEAISIEAAYEKRTKQAAVTQRIAQSTATNKSRLRILQAREQHLQDLFDVVRKRLVDISKDQSQYSKLLVDLILQGLLTLMETEVTVHVRPADVELAKQAATKASAQFKEKSGKSVTVTVKDGLSKQSHGGVRLIGNQGRISVNNELDERLRILEEKMLPEIRSDLFGANPNRKHYN